MAWLLRQVEHAATWVPERGDKRYVLLKTDC